MMIRLTLALWLLVSIPVTAAGPSADWLPGLDFVFPVTVYTDQPKAAIFGYDRDSHRASVLFPADGCYITWWITPGVQYGAIRQMFDYHVKAAVSLIVIYYENGHIEMQGIPAASYCIPL